METQRRTTPNIVKADRSALASHRVAADRQILDRNNVAFGPGDPLDNASLSASDIKEHVRSGHAVRKGQSIDNEKPPEEVPTVRLHNPATGEGIKTDAQGNRNADNIRDLVTQDAEKDQLQNLNLSNGTKPLGDPESHLVDPNQSDQGRVKQAVSPWNLDPKSLQGKTADQLNVMIRERDRVAPIMETPEEGIAFLSKDFNK